MGREGDESRRETIAAETLVYEIVTMEAIASRFASPRNGRRTAMQRRFVLSGATSSDRPAVTWNACHSQPFVVRSCLSHEIASGSRPSCFDFGDDRPRITSPSRVAFRLVAYENPRTPSVDEPDGVGDD